MTWQLLTAARTLWQEARNQPLIGQQAVAAVLWNRVKFGRWGKSIAAVCLWRAGKNQDDVHQFSGWNWNDPNFQEACNLDDADPELQKMLAIVIAAETMPDPTGGAQFYYATSIPEPIWAKSMIRCGQFGSQIFLRET
jgi:spore germination cell wall hydrolase CwlJ-like protein